MSNKDFLRVPINQGRILSKYLYHREVFGDGNWINFVSQNYSTKISSTIIHNKNIC